MIESAPMDSWLEHDPGDFQQFVRTRLEELGTSTHGLEDQIDRIEQMVSTLLSYTNRSGQINRPSKSEDSVRSSVSNNTFDSFEDISRKKCLQAAVLSATTQKPPLEDQRPSVTENFALDFRLGPARTSCLLAEKNTSLLPHSWPVSLMAMRYLAELPVEVDTAIVIRTSSSLSFETFEKPLPTVVARPAFVLLPTSRRRALLDAIGMVCLLYDLAFLPVQFAWDHQAVFISTYWTIVVAVFISAYWTVDIFVNFCTAVHTFTGDFDTNPRKIAENYARRYLVYDLALLACDWVGVLAEAAPEGKGLKHVSKYMRLIRLFRIARIVFLDRLFINFDVCGFAFSSMAEILKILLLMFFFVHVTSCLWFAIGNLRSTDTGLNWLNQHFVEEGGTAVEEESNLFQYLSALQWTVSTMVAGSSEISPANSIELAAACVVTYTGLVLEAVFVSTLSAVYVEHTLRKRSEKTIAKRLNTFLAKHRLKEQFALTASSQLTLHFLRSSRAVQTTTEVEGLGLISSRLRNNILFELFAPVLRKHCLFYVWSHVDFQTISMLTWKSMELMYVSRRQDVFMVGISALHAYVISKGSAYYMQDPRTSKVKEPTCMAVGSGAWLSEAAMWCEWFHVGTLEADTNICEVQTLVVESFTSVVKSNVKFNYFVRDYAAQYHLSITRSVPPYAPWPSDIEVQGTSFAQIVTSMANSARVRVSEWSLNYALNAGLINKSKLQVARDELQSRRSCFILNRAASSESLQRIVSVVRVAAKRWDERLFAQIGEWSSGEWILECRLPGVKQKGGEDISHSVSRLFDRLTPAIGETEYDSFELSDEIKLSQRTDLSTHYYIMTCHFMTCHFLSQDMERRVSLESKASLNSRRSVKSLAKQFSPIQSMTTTFHRDTFHRDPAVFDEIIEIRDANDRFMCAWLTQKDIEFLQTRSGHVVLQNDARVREAVVRGCQTVVAPLKTKHNL